MAAGREIGREVGNLLEDAAYGATARLATDLLPASWDVLGVGREATGAVVLAIAGSLTGSTMVRRAARAAATLAGADAYVALRGPSAASVEGPANEGDLWTHSDEVAA